jgi:hypothetical protein
VKAPARARIASRKAALDRVDTTNSAGLRDAPHIDHRLPLE